MRKMGMWMNTYSSPRLISLGWECQAFCILQQICRYWPASHQDQSKWNIFFNRPVVDFKIARSGRGWDPSECFGNGLNGCCCIQPIRTTRDLTCTDCNAWCVTRLLADYVYPYEGSSNVVINGMWTRNGKSFSKEQREVISRKPETSRNIQKHPETSLTNAGSQITHVAAQRPGWTGQGRCSSFCGTTDC